MATINLGKIKPNWKGEWATSTVYVLDDIVKSNVSSYICTTGHTAPSSGSFATSQGWELMMQGSSVGLGAAGEVLLTNGAGTDLEWGPAVSKQATAPSSPSEGAQWFNTSASTVSGISSKSLAVYNGVIWQAASVGSPIFSGIGGSKTTSGLYTIHTYTTSGIFTPNIPGNIEVMIVGGGGGGAVSEHRGGGGGGGIYYKAVHPVEGRAYSIAIGAGGSGTPGINTDAFGISAPGGGYSNVTNGGAGGNGSGASHDSGTGGVGTMPAISGWTAHGGYNGGNGGAEHTGGGGGGAGGVGYSTTNNGMDAGDGGVGHERNINGTSLYWAGGGGGGGHVPTTHGSSNGNGGLGGGGAGGSNGNSEGSAYQSSGGGSAFNSGEDTMADGSTRSGGRGGANTGGGGGGSGGNGGTGIVIVRYLT